MVPVTLRPAVDGSGTFVLWSDPRCGWNCPALPPPVGRARASDVDEPGQRDTRQRAPLVLPRRRFRYGTEKGTRARRPARRGAAHEPEHWNTGVRAPGSGRILRHDQCALFARATFRSSKVIENTKQIAVQVFGNELVQTPWL